MNVKGKCTNQQCPRYGQEVPMNLTELCTACGEQLKVTERVATVSAVLTVGSWRHSVGVVI